MFKTIVAGVTALSLSFTSAAPVQAGGLTEDEIGKLLFGLAAVAVIGSLVENNHDRRKVEVTRTPTLRQTPQIQRGHQPTRSRQNPNRRALPRECLRRVETRRGVQRVFGARCLRNNYAFADRLPGQCIINLRTNIGPRRGFDPACLRSFGFTARR